MCWGKFQIQLASMRKDSLCNSNLDNYLFCLPTNRTCVNDSNDIYSLAHTRELPYKNYIGYTGWTNSLEMILVTWDRSKIDLQVIKVLQPYRGDLRGKFSQIGEKYAEMLHSHNDTDFWHLALFSLATHPKRMPDIYVLTYLQRFFESPNFS